MNSLRKIIRPVKKCTILSYRRLLSTYSEESARQCEIFATEQKKQKESVGRIEKIEVQYEGQPENSVFSMNKNISTPYDCAKHLGDKIRDRSVVALLNGKTLWHMNRPLSESCILELLHYNFPNPAAANKVFWRTCSFVLGAVASDAFKDNIEIHLHSFPSPNVKSGSFVYDIQIGLDKWEPKNSELKVLSLEFIKFCQKQYPIECLNVDKKIALEIFKNNPHKSQQIPDIAAHNSDKITLFKAGPHIDISRGPMLPNTNHIGRITVTNVIKLDTDIEGGSIYRFQGVALPRTIALNHFAYGLIEERGKLLNSGRIPGAHGTLNEDNSFVAHVN
ncbi:39S ribosomal protein L39, mitochondrial [Sitophilus oryzae]|uniref:39S ribosomal protein L39, mitochondrial n=1 Tax=Sitophilus oryzae TaxID=7048 RepID=A0A6J2XKA0_SITOR|nr:39S ribosomal protein L39, mitochondrial [Sitophilus oryzae]